MRYKKSNISKILILLLSISILLTSCTTGKNNHNGLSSESPELEQSSEESKDKTSDNKTDKSHDSEADESTSRYDEVFDTSKDDGKLVARFFEISSGTDTKSGDAMFIKSPEGATMLIDAGAPECGAQVSKYLKELGVTKIDYLVASHPHIDHIGGFSKIINDFEIGAVYMSELVYPTKTYEAAMKSIQNKDLDIIYIKEGDEFEFGDSVVAKVYNPQPDIEYPKGYPERSTQFVNDHSVVLKLTYDEVSMLFMGDVYMQKELEFIEKYGDELQADLIKAGHHGADTSSSGTFIETVKPELAIFTHDSIASLKTYKSYRKRDAMVYITAIDGNILVSTDGKTLTDVTERDRVDDFLD